MAYTDNETKKDWKSRDKQALDGWAEEFEVDADEVANYLDGYDTDSNDINAHIEGVLFIGGCKYLSAIREYCDENNIDYSDSKLEENNEPDVLNIYTNYLDSGFDTELSDLITLNPDEENILQALNILEVQHFKNELDLDLSDVDIKVATDKLNNDSKTLTNEEACWFIKECEFDIFQSSLGKDAYKIVDKQGVPLGDIENEQFGSLNEVIDRLSGSYLIDYGFLEKKDDEDSDALDNLVSNYEKNIENIEIEEMPTGVERFNGKEVFLLEDWMPDSEFEKFNFYYENEKSSDETIDEALINFDRITIYEDYTKKEIGEEIAFQLNLFNDISEKAKEFIDYEEIADEYVNDEDSGYKKNENGEYFFIDEHQKLTGVFLGSVKNLFTANEAFDFVQFNKDGSVTNNGLISSLDRKSEDLDFDNVFKYYNLPTYIKKEQWNNEIKPFLEKEDYNTSFEKIKSIRDSILLFKDEKEYEKYKEDFKDSTIESTKKLRRDR